jgi:putative salt-induced outer membrane protein YdiY
MIQPIVALAVWSLVHSVPVVPEGVPAPGLQDAPGPTEPKWTGSITAGGIYTSGNSDTRSANATADAVLEREKDRVTLGFTWIYAEEKNTTADWNLTDRKTSARAKYDYFFTKQTYVYGLITTDHDKAADLSLRWTVGAGLGRQFVDNDTWKFGAEAGLTYFDNDYKVSDDDNYVAARLAANTTYTMNTTWSFLHTLELYPSLEDMDDFYARSDARAKATLTENMLAQLQWVVDYDNTPATGAERVDQRILASVGWKF